MDEKEAKALAILDAHFTVFEGRTYEHISSMFKWLVATLFAANGGGLLFLAKQGFVAQTSCSARLFALGLICSILVAITSLVVGQLASRDFTSLRSQIQIAALNDEIDEPLRAKLATPKKPSIWIWTPAAIGLVSFVLFSIGLGLQLSG